MQILECRKLQKIYGSGEGAVQALRDVSTGFAQGEICAVRGPSGSGKSTLLHILGGLEYPSSGKVFYRGEDLYAVLLDKRKPDRKHISLLVEMLGLGKRLDHLPSALSGGQQQRVAIARALANKPAILFADEPTGNLDGKSGKEVLALLKYASRELGVTLVLVTHDLNIAEQAERVITLEDGAITHDSRKGAAGDGS